MTDQTPGSISRRQRREEAVAYRSFISFEISMIVLPLIEEPYAPPHNA